MKFRIGDRVRFLNETGGGKITRIDDRDYLYVMTEDGFEIPVRDNELILQTPSSGVPVTRMPADKFPNRYEKEAEPLHEKIRKPELPEDRIPVNIPSGSPVRLLLGLVPDDSDAVFKASVAIYLINDCEYFLYYRIGYQQQGKYYYLKSGEIEPNTKCFLENFDQMKLSKITLFHIQALPVSAGQYFRMQPLDEEIDIAHYDFMKNHMYKTNDYFEEKALIPGVTLTILQKQLRTLKDSPESKDSSDASDSMEKKAGSKVSDNMEVDLHIEALRDDYSGLSNGEILRIQMNCFRSAIEDAISNKVKRIVFIHGVGNGTLKLELRNELKRNYPECTSQDASFKEYGFGATMVHLR
jgi:hypothetical protein